MRTVALALLVCLTATAGPVPRSKQPDPLGRGYMGFYPAGDAAAVQRVEENTPAAAAGLKAGDVFVRIGTLRPKSFGEIVSYVQSLRPGTRVVIVVRRGAEEVPLVLRLMAREPGT